ncbi:hypothetical protein B0H67DRAFT_650220 [Lasiosphaeris hirsuta]|uniref:Uncharacterized protein n=1 Tax=Lasiosphaeris hirsuta TaxID=260670 RepID=A0AA40DGF7_9PEZI|nr:hypothetical protein B0H67DRAFT_650220 [Lasiosphaeris hirsuta]
MSPATRARWLDEDASITVFEQGPYVSYANCGVPYDLGDVIYERASLILQMPEIFKVRFNTDVWVNYEASDIDPVWHMTQFGTWSTFSPHTANMTVFDMEHLELTYAPPYGSAKDPVNMVGFIGSYAEMWKLSTFQNWVSRT